MNTDTPELRPEPLEPSAELDVGERNEPFVPKDLGRLIESAEIREDDLAPGEQDRSLPRERSAIDWPRFAESLLTAVSDQKSALSKSRALCVAGLVLAQEGDTKGAEECLAKATEVSPRLAVSAMLHRMLSEDDAGASVRRSSEASMRQASQEESRIHATWALLGVLRRSDEQKEYRALLDHAARTRPADQALVLHRLAHRIAENQSLAGVEIPPALRDPVLWSQELLASHGTLTGHFTPADDFPHKKSLALLRAARLLDKNEYLEAVTALGDAGLEEEHLFELEAACRVTQVGQGKEATRALKTLAVKRPSRRILRNLAFRAAASDDPATLCEVLENADPKTGTFALLERALLGALGKKPLRLAEQERASLADAEPALALSLGAPTETAPVLDQASEEALLVQLGATLDSFSKRDDKERRLGDRAALELERRGGQAVVVAAFRLAQALASPAGPHTIEALRGFCDAAGERRGELVVALISERCFGTSAALPVYRSAAEIEPRFLEAKLHAEQLVDPHAGRSELVQLHDQAESRWLRFVRALSLLAFDRASTPSEEPGAPLDLSILLSACQDLLENDEQGEAAQQHPENLDVLLYSASALAEARGETFLRDAFRELLTEGSSPYARFVQFSTDWQHAAAKTVRSMNEKELDRRLDGYARSDDPTLRALARTLSDGPPRAGGDALGTPFEKLITLLDGALLGSLDSTEFLSAAFLESLREPELPWRFDWLRSLLDDVEELQGDVENLASRFLAKTKDSAEPEERRFALSRLFDLDEGRGDAAAAAMWQKTLCEEFPDYLPGLFRMEELRIQEGATDRAHALRERIAAELPPRDSRAYALLFGAEALARSDLRSARKALEPLLSEESPPALALRALQVVAAEKRDDALSERLDELLFLRATTDLDRCATALSAAYCRSRCERPDEARAWADKALQAKPLAFAAAQLVAALSSSTDPVLRAEVRETLATSAFAAPHRCALWLDAANAWQDAADPVREAASLQAVLAAEQDHREAFQRLLSLWRAGRDLSAQKRLLIDRVSRLPASSEEFLMLTLDLSELLIKSNQAREAKEYLERALAHHPKSSKALRVHADISAKLGEHESAERSLVALRDRLPPGEDRTAVLRSLARLYSDEFGQWERAMDAFQEVLSASPGEPEARERLVEIYARLGLGERAAALQTEIIVDAQSTEDKRAGALRLADIYESACRDEKRAVATLERARKAWPLDADVLEASIRFMDRHGGGPRGFVLDRVAKDARRKLEEGRLNAACIDTLARVALLTDAAAQNQACLLASAAYSGEPHEPLRPAGLSCLDEKLEELLAPAGLAHPLRSLFRRTGAAMDLAFAVDLGAFGARRLDIAKKDEAELDERIQKISTALSQGPVEVFVAEGLGARCLPVTSRPLRFLLGSGFVSLPGRRRDYLLLRAFKIQIMGVGALSRSRPEDRSAMTVALLQLFAPSWQAMNVDARKVAQARVLIEQSFARIGYEDDLPMLALETIGALGGQTSAPLGEASKRLASRAALVGVGDLAECLEAIAASEGKALPTGGPSRFRFIEAHLEARDLILFSTSDAFTQVRTSLGLLEGNSASSPTAAAPAPPHVSLPPRGTETNSRPPALPSRRPAPAPPRRPPSKSEE